MEHVIPVLVLSLACGAWVLIQRAVARLDPEQPGVEGSGHGCAGCHPTGDKGPACRACPAPNDSLSPGQPPC